MKPKFIILLLHLIFISPKLNAQSESRPGFNNAIKVSFISPFFHSWAFSYERMLSDKISVQGIFGFRSDKFISGEDALDLFQAVRINPTGFSAFTPLTAVAFYRNQWGAMAGFRFYPQSKGFDKPGGFHLGLNFAMNTQTIEFTVREENSNLELNRNEQFVSLGLCADAGMQIVIKKRLLIDLFVNPGLYHVAQSESGNAQGSKSGIIALFAGQAMLGFAF